MYGLLTKSEVKLVGYWRSFFGVFVDRDTVEVHKLAKKWQGQYPATFIKQAWSIRIYYVAFGENFSCRARWVVPSGQDSFILPTNHRVGFDSSCPLKELATYLRISPNFQNCAHCEKNLKDSKDNSLYLGRKYTRILFCPWTLSVPPSS